MQFPMTKKKLAILDKNAHWWAKEKLDWATQDKDGHWWIFRDKKMKTKTPKKRKESMSFNFSWKEYILLTMGSALGIILGLVVAKLINAI